MGEEDLLGLNVVEARKRIDTTFRTQALEAYKAAELTRNPVRHRLIRYIEDRIDFLTNWYEVRGMST